MRTVNILRDYYDKKDYVYRKGQIDIQSGLTVLVGCNGCGKTTFLNHLRRELEEDSNVELVTFNNVSEGGHAAMDKAMFYGDTSFVMRAACSSEGERIRQNLEKIASACGKAFRSILKSDSKKELWVLLDAVDSGLSVDNIVELKEDLLHLLVGDCESKGIEIYILASANEYEMARGEKCLDIQNGKYVKINSYEQYRQLVLKTRKYKDKRYK